MCNGLVFNQILCKGTIFENNSLLLKVYIEPGIELALHLVVKVDFMVLYCGPRAVHINRYGVLS